MTIKVREVGAAKAVVESFYFPTEAEPDEYVGWNFGVHNIGETGIMGGAIQNYSGPDSIVIRWSGKEVELEPSTTKAWILYNTDPVPNCSRIEASGEVKFKSAGSYTIRILGVHREDGDWYIDDEKIISVSVREYAPPAPPKTPWEKLVELWNSLSTWQKAALLMTPIGAVGVISYVRSRKG